MPSALASLGPVKAAERWTRRLATQTRVYVSEALAAPTDATTTSSSSASPPTTPTQTNNKRRAVAILILLALLTVGVSAFAGVVVALRRLAMRHRSSSFSAASKSSHAKKHHEDDDPDPSGLCSYRLTPTRAHLKLDTSKPLKYPTLPKQMTSPYLHSKTHKRTYGCLRDECRGLAMEDLSDRKWRMLYKTGKEGPNTFRQGLTYKVTLLLTDGTELAKLEKLHPEAYTSIIKDQEGKTYLEALENADAIGGNKGQQLRTKMKFAKKRKCSYDALGLQPAQHRLYIKEECDSFVRKTETKFTFLLKPETGSQGHGITFHSNPAAVMRKVPQFFPCRENVSINAVDRFLVQEYIARPLLVKKAKFDMRVYLLIASSDPWIVFYREGYLRRSLHAYQMGSKDRAVYLTNTHYQSLKEGFKLSEHIWTFENLQDYLTKNGLTGPHYVDAIVEPYIKRVANFVFQSARSKLKRRKGSFHIFGLDFMIDDRLRVHFIEANGYPGYTWSLNYDTRGLVTDIMDLVLELHEAPAVFERLRAGDMYGGFHLIFSELEEERRGLAYDPCFVFFNNERYFDGMRASMRHAAKFSGYAASRILLRDSKSSSELDDEPCVGKVCKAKAKLAAKEAAKARSAADRAFEGMSDEVEGALHMGGAKSLQLTTLSTFTSQHGCSLNELGVSPASYRWPHDCSRALKFRTPSKWILKPDDHTGDGGRNFAFVASQKDLESVLGACPESLMVRPNTPVAKIVQRRVVDVLVVDGTRWSLRAYMLIASTKPWFVFFHSGFARTLPPGFFADDDELMRGGSGGGSGGALGGGEGESVEGGGEADAADAGADAAGGEDEDAEAEARRRARKKAAAAARPRFPPDTPREITLEEYQYQLSHANVAGARFVQTHVETFQRRVAELVYRAARPHLVSKPKTHHLIEMDFVVDESLRVWYIASNSAPTFSSEVPIRAKMQDDMRSLVLELADAPEAYAKMRPGDGYGDFRLITSDFVDVHARGANTSVYDPCAEFKKKWSLPRSVARHAAVLHDVNERGHAANERELKKYVVGKWRQCRERGRASSTCAQLVRDFVTDRYRIFLQKERLPVVDAEVQEWVDDKLAELSGEETKAGAGAAAAAASDSAGDT